MDNNKTVLCSASFYKQGYFFNEEYSTLPENIKRELKVIAVCLSEKIRAISIFGFYKDTGDFYIEVLNSPDDFLYDEIGAKLELMQVEKENQELFSSLTLWYKTFILKDIKL
ncbi:MAG: DUF6145 family protein [Lachnospirales bacterium]